jgi:hypothetical protein
VRVLQDQEKLHITSTRGAQKEKELLLAQLEEHHYHLRYNLRMRDLVVESLQKWQAKHEPGMCVFTFRPLNFNPLYLPDVAPLFPESRV